MHGQICKDKDEAEVWFVGLKGLISRGTYHNLRNEAINEGISLDSPLARRTHLSGSSSVRSNILFFSWFFDIIMIHSEFSVDFCLLFLILVLVLVLVLLLLPLFICLFFYYLFLFLHNCLRIKEISDKLRVFPTVDWERHSLT